jgi:hypothetical protein
MPRYPRKTAPKVRDGKVQKKNRHGLTPHHSQTSLDDLAIERQRPGAGYRHLLSTADVTTFIGILPNWDDLAVGLDAVLLAPGDPDAMGWCDSSRIAVCAWDREIENKWHPEFVDEHAAVLDRLGVELVSLSKHEILCKFDENSARGFQLMHIFLHELGHHRDRMTTRRQVEMGRGESYAEKYANAFADQIWERYFEVFDF